MLNDGPNLDVQRLMHEIRARVASENGSSESQNPPATVQTNGNPKQARQAGHYHVNELLGFHGEDFVRNAYRVLLDREPDEAGVAHHMDQLASGRFNKIDVLSSLHSSPEGRQSQVKLSGLSLPVTVRRLGRLPVIGYVVRLFVSIARLPLLIQHQNRYELYNWSQQQRIVAQQTHHHKELNETLQQISAQILEIMQRAAQQQQANELSLRQSNELSLQQYEALLVKYQEFASATEARLARNDESSLNLSQQISSQAQQLTHYQQTLEQLQQVLQQQHQLLQQQQQAVSEQKAETQKGLNDQQQITSQIRADIQPLILQQQKTDVELLMQERRLTVLLQEVARSTPSLAEVAKHEEEHLHDSLYASFEDEFRGPRDEVRRRLQVYIPFLKEAEITGGLLDIGCGRGEWLQLVQSEGIDARGVDRNRVFIEQCRAAGLNVVENDALIYLRSLPAESLNAVTIFHLVEHLPLETLINVVDEIVRTLKHDGLLIIETPNPENLIVGSHTFYVDPTHRNPIPSQTLQFLLEARGLRSLEILKLRPRDEVKLAEDSELVTRFNEYFYSAPDYGIIARKP
jgi:O-antigen chain-terminating methyltransferase